MTDCLECGKLTLNPKFCSLSCSATYNLKRRAYPKPKKVNCLECGIETTNPKFCDNSCSAKYSNKRRKNDFKNDKRTKLVNCCDCEKEIEVNIRSPKNGCKCENCRIYITTDSKKIRSEYTKHKICNYCGCGECSIPKICRKYQLFPALIKYFGFDETKIGTIGIYEEFERIKELIREEYHINRLSLSELISKYSDEKLHHEIFRKILKALGIERRTISKALSQAIYDGKIDQDFKKKKYYKQGWHISWNGKKFFYRSSYELNYCKILDDQMIDYEMEKLRFWYWDTQKQKQRVAIPDFYIPVDNMIVEIKSNWTYDEQNMRDRVKAFEEHGYIFKMILEGKEDDSYKDVANYKGE